MVEERVGGVDAPDIDMAVGNPLGIDLEIEVKSPERVTDPVEKLFEALADDDDDGTATIRDGATTLEFGVVTILAGPLGADGGWETSGGEVLGGATCWAGHSRQ